MKYSILITFLLISICQGFPGPIEQAVNQGVTDSKNVADQISNVANGIQFSAKFLWSSVFSPAFDMMIEGKIVGQPIPANPLSDKYAQLSARLKTNIHNLYEQLFVIEQEAMNAIGDGEMNFEERIQAFNDKVDGIQTQINQWVVEMKSELETFAQTIPGDWQTLINQYQQTIDSTVQSIKNMFQQLTQNLIKNFLDFISNIIPNANNIIEMLKEQGLLSFLGK